MRRHLLIAAVAAVAALSLPAGAAAACSGVNVQPTPENLDAVSATTLCLINEQRADNGLPALSRQDQLDQASVDYSQLMVDQQFFAHVSPDGGVLTQRLTDAGYLGGDGAWVVGENIAWGESYLGTPGAIVAAWMNSPGHRANILSTDYDEIGVGIAIGVPTSSNDGATYTTDFGRRDGDGSDPVDDGEIADTEGGESADPDAATPKPTATKHRTAPVRKASRAGAQRKASRHKAATLKASCKPSTHRGAGRIAPRTRCLGKARNRTRHR